MPVCCPPGSWPQLLRTKEELNKDDVPAPKGKLVTTPTAQGKDLPLYVVEPQGGKSKGAILVIPDIYSVRVLTSQVRSGDRIGLICDMLADTGYTVALAGIFRDQPFDLAVSGPADGDFEKFNCMAQDGGVDWFKAQTYQGVVGPDVKAAAEFLSSKTGGQALGVLGFCFGTWALTKTSFMGDVEFACGVGCHPATGLEGLHGGDEIKMLQGVKMPTKFLWAGNDPDVFKEGGAGKAALDKTGGGVEEYPDMLHGWVSRGDMADDKVKKDVEKAIDSILGFFQEKMPIVE